jgi:alpha-L-fucosidase
VPVAEYAKLAERFTAERFDADAIADLAVEAGMRYINLTTRHHDSFCLFKTEETDFHALNTPCGRDLVGEMAEACRKRGLGFFLYYSHGRDWKHPHAPNNDQWGGSARPEYDPPEPSYAYGEEHDLQKYLDFMTRQVTELLGQYGPVAGIWLDGIGVPNTGDRTLFRCQELYDHVHRLQPQVLVSYKQGLLGTEDFFAPEHKAVDSQGKLMEICTTTIREPNSWGYNRAAYGHHLGPDAIWGELAKARASGSNLLLNVGPKADGSIPEEDVRNLRAVGERLRKDGFPEGA